MKTLTEQYRLIKEDKGHKGVFLKEAKRQFPNLIKNNATFNEASKILKQKNIISENYIDLQPINNPIERKKESYETAFANFLAEAEAKAEEKKVTKEVEEDYSKNYDQRDKKDPNNMIFGQIQMGVFYEAKLDKNKDKTLDEIKDIVFKNLAKDPIYYTKTGQFGEDIGYVDDAPGLGEPKEPKGPHKSSGYGKIEGESKFKYVVNESKKPVNEVIVGGGLVTGVGFSPLNYMDFFGLNEDERTQKDTQDILDQEKAMQKLADTAERVKDIVGEGEAPVHIEALTDAAEAAYDAGMSIDEIMSMIEQHLGLKMGDF